MGSNLHKKIKNETLVAKGPETNYLNIIWIVNECDKNKKINPAPLLKPRRRCQRTFRQHATRKSGISWPLTPAKSWNYAKLILESERRCPMKRSLWIFLIRLQLAAVSFITVIKNPYYIKNNDT